MPTSTLWDGLLHRRFWQNFFPIPATHQFPIGSIAPSFELLNVAIGKQVSWADYLNHHPWVLLAFTRIFSEKHYCPLCYPHIMELNAAHEKLQQQGIEVLLITSTDPSQSQVVWQDLQLKMPLLSDPTCQIFRQYQVGQALGAPLPAQFLIDRTGRIQFRHLFSFIEPNASIDRLLALIKQFSNHADHV